MKVQFNRGLGLNTAVQAIQDPYGDVLLFICDVDVTFNRDFMNRCRLNAVPGKQVYFPIVFSLYRDKVVLKRVLFIRS